MNHNDKDIVAWQYVTISRNHVLAINVCAKRLLSREIIQQSVDFSSFFMLTIVKASNIKVMVVLRCPKNVNYNVMHTFYVSIVLGLGVYNLLLKLQPLHRFLCVICVMIVIFLKEINTNILMHHFRLNISVRLLGIIKHNTVYSSAENKCQDILYIL